MAVNRYDICTIKVPSIIEQLAVRGPAISYNTADKLVSSTGNRIYHQQYYTRRTAAVKLSHNQLAVGGSAISDGTADMFVISQMLVLTNIGHSISEYHQQYYTRRTAAVKLSHNQLAVGGSAISDGTADMFVISQMLVLTNIGHSISEYHQQYYTRRTAAVKLSHNQLAVGGSAISDGTADKLLHSLRPVVPAAAPLALVNTALERGRDSVRDSELICVKECETRGTVASDCSIARDPSVRVVYSSCYSTHIRVPQLCLCLHRGLVSVFAPRTSVVLPVTLSSVLFTLAATLPTFVCHSCVCVCTADVCSIARDSSVRVVYSSCYSTHIRVPQLWCFAPRTSVVLPVTRPSVLFTLAASTHIRLCVFAPRTSVVLPVTRPSVLFTLAATLPTFVCHSCVCVCTADVCSIARDSSVRVVYSSCYSTYPHSCATVVSVFAPRTSVVLPVTRPSVLFTLAATLLTFVCHSCVCVCTADVCCIARDPSGRVVYSSCYSTSYPHSCATVVSVFAPRTSVVLPVTRPSVLFTLAATLPTFVCHSCVCVCTADVCCIARDPSGRVVYSSCYSTHIRVPQLCLCLHRGRL
ncbi:hypothetical protein J6590_038684 [Homalodisca vitripennis]|nr:hypothetical protein J6590_038684 [Homalodisca vitripennis]